MLNVLGEGPRHPPTLMPSLSWGGFFGLGRSWNTPKALLVDLGLVSVDLGSSWTLVDRFFMEFHRFSTCPGLPGSPENLEKPMVFIGFSTFSWNRLFGSR